LASLECTHAVMEATGVDRWPAGSRPAHDHHGVRVEAATKLVSPARIVVREGPVARSTAARQSSNF